MRMLLFAVEIWPHRVATGEFFNRRRVTFDFCEGRSRGQAELLGENVEDACETNQSREFRDCTGRKIF